MAINNSIIGRLNRIEGKINFLIKRCKSCSEEPESEFTVFNLSTLTGDGCSTPDLTPYNNTMYHDGEGALPALGDTVYTDAAGTTPLVTEPSEDYQMSDGNYLRTDESGIRIDISCK